METGVRKSAGRAGFPFRNTTSICCSPGKDEQKQGHGANERRGEKGHARINRRKADSWWGGTGTRKCVPHSTSRSSCGSDVVSRAFSRSKAKGSRSSEGEEGQGSLQEWLPFSSSISRPARIPAASRAKGPGQRQSDQHWGSAGTTHLARYAPALFGRASKPNAASTLSQANTGP